MAVRIWILINSTNYPQIEFHSISVEQKLENAEEASEFGEAGLDEMTLLNQFFANKWRKLSFIYNFVRNEMTYTQIPAYLR